MNQIHPDVAHNQRHGNNDHEALYVVTGDITTAIAAHVAASDPHTGYATDTDLSTHAAAADPHTGYLLESLLDAKGDLIAASADNMPAKVTVGADGTLLIADAAQTAGVRWTTIPSVRVNRSATLSLTNNTITDLTWNTDMYDSHAMHDTSSNTARLTCVLAGLHHIELNLEFQANATGFRGIHIVHSADSIIAKHYLPQVGAAVSPIMHVSCDHDMSVGEYVYAQAWQTSGGNLLVGNSLWDTFSARWVRTSP